jgi:leucyl-tRNA synthetase
MFILFKAPPEKDLEWDDADVEGQFRFLQRIWRQINGARERGLSLNGSEASVAAQHGSQPPNPDETELRRAVHTAIEAISEDLEDPYQFNTAIAELMKLSNAISSHLERCGDAVAVEALTNLLVLLAPFAPHLAAELWQQLGGADAVHRQSWPQVDHSALVRDTVQLVIQIKGKVRGSLEVPADADRQALEQLALGSDIAAKWLEGRAPSRVIVVPGKLVNLVP